MSDQNSARNLHRVYHDDDASGLVEALRGKHLTFRYCNAGHPYPILVSSGAARTLEQGGAVLRVCPTWTYQDSNVNLSSGERLLLFTDGITEAEGSDGDEFGTERVAAFAKAHAANSAAKMNQQLLAQVTEFCGALFRDDATLVVLAVK